MRTFDKHETSSSSSSSFSSLKVPIVSRVKQNPGSSNRHLVQNLRVEVLISIKIMWQRLLLEITLRWEYFLPGNILVKVYKPKLLCFLLLINRLGVLYFCSFALTFVRSCDCGWRPFQEYEAWLPLLLSILWESLKKEKYNHAMCA